MWSSVASPQRNANIFKVIYAAAILLHALELVVPPPSRYPDLFPVLNVLISTPVFFLTWLWSIKSGAEVGWALGGLGHSQAMAVAADQRSSEDSGTAVASGVGGESTGSFRQAGRRAVSLSSETKMRYLEGRGPQKKGNEKAATASSHITSLSLHAQSVQGSSR